MTEMIICGFLMEMESAKEFDGIGDCRMCLYADWIEYEGDKVKCSKKGTVKQRTNCNDWIVDHR